MIITVLIVSVLFVAYANGANDNFKGVATLFGGKVLNYQTALLWSTLTTFAGSILSFFIGTRLLKLFTGTGIVADTVAADPAFFLSVALAAALTIMLATRIGMPISTTHSLVGAVTGAGVAGQNIHSFVALGKSFFLPLIAGPLLAIVITILIYAACH